MFGYPGERHQDVRMTMRLLREIAPDEYSISIAYPMPGTKFYDLVRGSMPQEREWVNRDDTDIRFDGEYGTLYYRLARAVAHRRYAPRRPLRKRIEGWMLEPALLAARVHDEIFHRHPPGAVRSRSPFRGP
jgi:anaerobic magnesium-protoporphyrin IX monomethyl ester cyclase